MSGELKQCACPAASKGHVDLREVRFSTSIVSKIILVVTVLKAFDSLQGILGLVGLV